MQAQGRVLCALVALAVIAISAGRAAPSEAAACANEAIRAQQGSGSLPDCRAYEMVSPPRKGGNDVAPITNSIRGASNGGFAAWLSFGSFGDTEGTGVFSNYLSKRSASGWTTDGISPPTDPAPIAASGITGFSEDLSTAFVANPTPLTPNVAPETVNLYQRDSATGAYTLLSPSTNPTPLEPDPFGFHAASFLDVAPATGRVTFTSDANYVPEASGSGRKVYASDGGAVSVVSYLPNEELAPFAKRPGFVGTVSIDHTMSSDGSRIAFTVPVEAFSFDEEGGQLYLRDGSTTHHLTESQRTPADPAGPLPAMFWTMSADGSQVLLTSSEKLTDDSTACTVAECGPSPDSSRVYNQGWPELYRYDLESETLTDLTVHPGGAAVMGVLGASDDGSRIYFVASTELAAGAVFGELNLYSWHEGTIELVAVLAGDAAEALEDRSNWDSFETLPLSRLSADGERLLFRSENSLPGFDNGGAGQFYLYDAASGGIECVSCPPSGVAAGDAKIDVATVGTNSVGEYLPRALSADGERVFFSSPDPLVAADTNRRYDAYAYDARDGSVDLISSGRSETDAFFADASPDGKDVFFLTRERLLPQDRDANLDLYDARVEGGFPAQVGDGVPPCQGDECQGPLSAAPAPARPGSAGIDAGGDPKPNRQKAKRRQKAKKHCAKVQRKAGKKAKKRCTKRKGARR